MKILNISQFENHIRAVCGLKQIETKKIYNAKMINLIGEDISIYRNKEFKDNEFFFDYLKKDIKAKREVGRKIYQKNKSIQKAWNLVKSRFEGTEYKDFAQSLINAWETMDNNTKLEYGSFENFITTSIEEEKFQKEPLKGKKVKFTPLGTKKEQEKEALQILGIYRNNK